MAMEKLLILIPLLGILFGCSQIPEPEPIGPLPSESQLRWHEMEFYMFVHFNMNTFTNMEWGFGDESPEQFNPTELDCRQWARVASEAGMKGIILTAKHHDGFCLWPSAYTEHSVKNSPWKNGEGDVIRELSEACSEYGLKMGLYLSPWDRNHADYGTEKYITYYRNQVNELLTEYGEVFEFWLDGANGGTGYYGGANENRKVDRKTYYDWPTTLKQVLGLQPDVIIFSDAGPGTRWVGNEQGWAGKTNWSILRRDQFYPGSPSHGQLTTGQEDGTHWVPAEVDVSIRPGWYYHPYEDHRVHSLPHLLDIYYHSVGRNGNLLLNFPVDTRGVIHEKDVEQVMKLANTLKKDFASNIVFRKKAEATNTRGNSRKFAAGNLLDGNKETYWSTDDGISSASLTIDPGEEVTFNRLLLQEYIRLGQRVKEFSVEALVEGEWEEIASETTIGYKRILRLPTTTASKIRLNIKQSKACPLITNIEVYHAPKVLTEPLISRNRQGIVSIAAADPEVMIFYSTDGSNPAPGASTPYLEPFEVPGRMIVKALAVDEATGLQSPVSTREFDLAKKQWTITSPEDDPEKSNRAMDDDPVTSWTFPVGKFPGEFVVDLGEVYLINGITYLPDQSRQFAGIIEVYECSISEDGRNWTEPVASGEFQNIRNSPIWQKVSFPEKQGRYLKMKVMKTINEDNRVRVAEIGVITQ